MTHTNVFHFLAEAGDNARIRICATGSRGEGEEYFRDCFLELETQSEGVCYLPGGGSRSCVIRKLYCGIHLTTEGNHGKSHRR